MTSAGPWGIDDGYYDTAGDYHPTSKETAAALRRALGGQEGQASGSGILTARRGSGARIPPGELWLEQGGSLAVTDTLPAEVPLGYHRLVGDGGDRLLVVSPGRCYLPADLRTWGWAIQAYALRSATSWGFGDLEDLAAFTAGARRQGAGITMINPLHAAPCKPRQQPSPYSPSSRCWRNPLYIAVHEVPGAGACGARLEELAAAGRALNSTRLIDRDAVLDLKRRALELIWERGVNDEAFDAYRRREGKLLESFATFLSLDEAHEGPPRTWPVAYRHPGSSGVARWRDAHAERVRFFAWEQWLLEQQLERASEHTGLLHDLAIGVDPDGADAWLFKDSFAAGVTVGAPPDAFNAEGQDWGVAAFNPEALRAAGYEPFIRSLRAALRGSGGLRIDHVMDLWRLFLIPAGGTPRDGAYVRYPAPELLDVLALESQRAGAYVVGEDLGTVEPGVREELARRRVMSYRLLWFEETPPAEYPELALAALTNHALPTVAGLWSGADVNAQRSMGLAPDEGFVEAVRTRLIERAGVSSEAQVTEVIGAAYRALAGAPSRILSAQLEDALGIEERVNQPGTSTERANWSSALPVTVEDMARTPLVNEVAAALQRGPQRKAR